MRWGQLADRILFQMLVQLRLAEQHDLQQLALFRLQIGQQTQRFQAFHRDRLRLIQAQHDLLALPRQFHQARRDRLEQLVLIDVLVQRHFQFIGQRQHQRAWLQVGIGDIGGNETLAQGIDELAAQQRLASADLAGDLDEAFTIARRHQQRIEGLLRMRAGEEITGVRRDAKRRLAQAKVLVIHHRCNSSWRGLSSRTRRPASSKS